MHLFSILFGAALLGAPIVQASALAERAVVDGPCTGAGGAPGSCISTAKCSAGGGTSITGACPGTPADIRCCTKTSCGSGGNCRWTSQCTTGNTLSGLCPGPADFKCCVPKSGGGGGYPTPAFPAVGACKARAVDGAKKIVAGNPGKVRTESGAPIAEWVMNNRASLGLKYVIWGQKIWNPSQDAVKPWSQWRGMEDRGSITANHWDHVHVSYNA
ncbi:hypothetical protein H2199_005337 [Coniosporium tulheliwenetii]|uniref:Uncharacterized protein n=1 Tax=Coniosporium tulheliwenetii TaxID=3383036 RepID=A0ACC2Z1H1_9PEZI|nr:hypothetical protein H2199_005337 [Cladosporium sp. JES 115]